MLFSAYLAIAHLAHCCAIFHLVVQLTIAHHAVLLLPPICHFIHASALFFSGALLTNAVNCILQTGKMLKHDSTVFIVWQFHLTIARPRITCHTQLSLVSVAGFEKAMTM